MTFPTPPAVAARAVESSAGFLMVTEYIVPLRVHMAWCAHCAGGQP